MAEGESRDEESRDDELEREGEVEGKAEKEPEEDDRDRSSSDNDDGDGDGDGEKDEEERHAGPVKIVLVALGVILFTLLGLYIFSAVIAPGYISSLILGVVWFVIAAVLLGRLRGRRPHLAWPIRAAFIGTAVVVLVFTLATSVRDKTVSEDVVTGVKLSQAKPTAEVPEKPDEPAPPQNLTLAAGKFEAAEEGSASGNAALVKLADGGTKLTITDLDVAAGPDLRVYLAPGDGKSVSQKIDLGKLKGNRGDQQYDVPEGTDIEAYPAVVVYCRAFSVAFGRAELEPQ